ncbi:RidA family protein [Edaphobacter modestus]|uniref:Enamine deaminase RidA (YjgF/YER057c/UK114 family) n=1 Tax=Edaphobacter modestus TaxID=388466 RepID=A0A4Q7Z1Z2_9BACT|nr:RidA family protein [Edaphobacter modestus]RZU43529.1 enamine deaminase RidA (YjgF/YER057c/UK114 family) [Edaphobacter modestus]
MRILWVAMLAAASTLSAAAQGTKAQPQVTFQNSPEIASPAGYTHAVVVNGGKMIFVSGQVGLNKQGEMVGKNDFHAQAAQVFQNLKSVLVAAGATPKDIVKLNYLVVGLNHDKLVALRDVRDQFIDKEHPPASTLAGVRALFREDAMLEVEAVAVIP